MNAARTIPLAVPDLRGSEAEYLVRCVKDNWVSSAGPQVETFERALADFCETEHAVATMNGTAALHLALVVAGVGPGDLVVVPDFTFAATANAVIHAGATPLFVDVSEESWTLDVVALSDALGKFGDAVRAVVPVHALGHPADMDPILALCQAREISVIEDAAGAIGARYRGAPVGGLGDAAMFSFNGNKTLTTGGGGVMLTRRIEWAERARSLSTQARDGDAYRYREVGFNYRMPNINAALGLAQIERLDEMVAAKRAIAARYDVAFADRDDLRPMPRAPWADSACWLYSVKCADRDAAESLVGVLGTAGIGARICWESLSAQRPFETAERVLNGVSATLSGTVVSLPCSSSLTEADQARVIAAADAWQAPTAARLHA